MENGTFQHCISICSANRHPAHVLHGKSHPIKACVCTVGERTEHAALNLIPLAVHTNESNNHITGSVISKLCAFDESSLELPLLQLSAFRTLFFCCCCVQCVYPLVCAELNHPTMEVGRPGPGGCCWLCCSWRAFFFLTPNYKQPPGLDYNKREHQSVMNASAAFIDGLPPAPFSAITAAPPHLGLIPLRDYLHSHSTERSIFFFVSNNETKTVISHRIATRSGAV